MKDRTKKGVEHVVVKITKKSASVEANTTYPCWGYQPQEPKQVKALRKFWGLKRLWQLIFPLRKNAGGFHAKTKRRCLLFSSAILLVSIIFCADGVFKNRICSDRNSILRINFFMAPVENANKHLDEVEYRVYRKRTRVILLLEDLVFIFAFILGLEELVVVGTMDFL